jgi:hypothetical protein
MLGDNIKVDIKAVGFEGMIGIEMTQDRVQVASPISIMMKGIQVL